jgi:hypothetical protein
VCIAIINNATNSIVRNVITGNVAEFTGGEGAILCRLGGAGTQVLEDNIIESNILTGPLNHGYSALSIYIDTGYVGLRNTLRNNKVIVSGITAGAYTLYGILLYRQKNGRVEGNDVILAADCTIAGAFYGIRLEDCQYNTIDRNFLINVSGKGANITFNGIQEASPSDHNYVRWNRYVQQSPITLGTGFVLFSNSLLKSYKNTTNDVPLAGTFSWSSGSSKVVTSVGLTSSSRIHINATNANAGGMMGKIYITAGSGQFTVTTSDGSAAPSGGALFAWYAE